MVSRLALLPASDRGAPPIFPIPNPPSPLLPHRRRRALSGKVPAVLVAAGSPYPVRLEDDAGCVRPATVC